MANTDLVSKTYENANPSTNNSTQELYSSPIQQIIESQTTQTPSSSCLSYIRKFYKDKGFSEQSISIFTSSWRESTINQYEIYFKKWNNFCIEQKIDPMQYNEQKAIEFLTTLISKGYSYNYINTARSALSTILYNNAGITIGNCSLVKRFMKGVFEIRPPKPRYSFIWDVEVVFSYLKLLHPLEDLSLNCLTHKLCMLLALSSMQRVQTLHAISISDITFYENAVYIPIKTFLKQTSQKRQKFALHLKKYTEDASICVVTTLKFYLLATQNIRGDTKQLFISCQRPYNVVSKDTISRWLKNVLFEAGIDASIFKGHSTRAASASAAKRDNVDDYNILRTAGWNNNSTFKQFYDKAIIEM